MQADTEGSVWGLQRDLAVWVRDSSFITEEETKGQSSEGTYSGSQYFMDRV